MQRPAPKGAPRAGPPTRPASIHDPRASSAAHKLRRAAPALLAASASLLVLWWWWQQRPTVPRVSVLPLSHIPRATTSVQASEDAQQLWKLINSNAEQGACWQRRNQVVIGDDRVCLQPSCLRSAHGAVGTLALPFTPHPALAATAAAEGTQGEAVAASGIPAGCGTPVGGQRPPPPSAQGVEVSFVVDMLAAPGCLATGGRGSDGGSAGSSGSGRGQGDACQAVCQTLLQLFKTSGEAQSVEYLVVAPAPMDANHGGGDDGALAGVKQCLNSLRHHFGQRVALLRATAQAPGGAHTGVQPALAAASLRATGRYIALLQPGALPVPGWLQSLLVTLASHPEAGMVGPLLMSGDGQVVGSGGGVTLDGTPYVRGHMTAATHDLLHLRRVDFLPPACVLLPRALYLAAAGSSEDHGGSADRGSGPQASLFGDANLGLSIRAAGYQVMVQPSSIVAYQPYSASALFPSSIQITGPNAAQQQHSGSGDAHQADAARAALLARRARLLSSSGAGSAAGAGAHAGGRGGGGDSGGGAGEYAHYRARLLWMDDIVPEVDRESGGVRAFALNRVLLRMGFAVDMITRVPQPLNYTLLARHAGIDVRPALPDTCAYDVAVISRRDVHAAMHADFRRLCPHTPLIYDTVDIHFVREARVKHAHWAGLAPQALLPLIRGDAELVAGMDAELAAIDSSSVVWVVAQEDADLLKALRPQLVVHVVSNVHTAQPASSIPPFHKRAGALFVGNLNHFPNIQAITFFHDQVLPLLLPQLSAEEAEQFRWHIVGANGLWWTHNLTSPFVTLHRFLPDPALTALYGRVAVAVAPLLTGAGVKGKVNQAMSHGVPVVATSLAVEGMQLEHMHDVVVADGAQAFADGVVRVMRERALWDALSGAGRKNIQRHFTPDCAEGSVVATLRHVAPHLGV